jgi:hypothetical protein
VSEIYTEQVTAVTNVVLALFAIVTGVFAWLAWRGQKRQLGDLYGEREREGEERRRAQAVQVYVWQTPPTTPLQRGGGPETSRTASLVNSSRQPVYDVTIRWMTGGVLRGAAVREEPLKPEEVQTAVITSDTVTDLDGVVAVAFFRDRAGLWWRTYSDGRLEEHVTAPAATGPGE